MFSRLKKILNNPNWMPAMFGVFIGLSGFTFYYAQGLSYFSDDPKACKNCHIMRQQFDDWNRSSHKSAATCNGCHTPKNVVAKYLSKAVNGWNHSVAFTSNRFHEPMQIKKFNRDIVLQNCRRCHSEIIGVMAENAKGENTDCILCHGNVGHRNKK